VDDIRVSVIERRFAAASKRARTHARIRAPKTNASAFSCNFSCVRIRRRRTTAIGGWTLKRPRLETPKVRSRLAWWNHTKESDAARERE